MLDFLSTPTTPRPGLSAALVVVVALLAAVLRTGRRAKNLPPGPPTIPIFGNELQIQNSASHFRMTEWAREYGGLFSLKRFQDTVIVISDWKYVKQLLDKKSSIYSNRPVSAVAHQITGSNNIAMLQYGNTWRQMRRLINQVFMEANCNKHHNQVVEAEAIQMLYDFMERPSGHMLHPKRFSNSITMSLILGGRTKDANDNYMQRQYRILELWSRVLEIGATPPVDAFPLLKLVPEWLLGNWHSRAEECGDQMRRLYTDFVDGVKERRQAGVNKGSFLDHVLDQQEKNKFSDHQLAFLVGTMMKGGSDTSSALILAIIQAMTQYPEVQKRAQEEIDRAVGPERSPAWSDFPRLPYINMIIKEAHRWRPVIPLGVSHALAEDDSIDGMHLPKDSTIVINAWGLHHDEKQWKSPEHFVPERYQDYPELAPFYAASSEKRDHVGYGASRRICPGIHLAERNLFIGAAKLLWAFDFTLDAAAKNDATAETGSSSGFIHCVKDYGCKITLRDEGKRATIIRELEGAQEVFARFE